MDMELSREDFVFAEEVLARGLITIDELNRLLKEMHAGEERLTLSQFMLRKRFLATNEFMEIKKTLEAITKEKQEVRIKESQYKVRSVAGAPVIEKSLSLPKIGKYEIIKELGRGGMGVVYAAKDETLGRVVALKTMRSADDADSVDLERFQREARLAASLQHPNIIAVHDIGVHDKIHYFTMDYIEGMPIGEYVKKHHCTPTQIATMIRDVAEALAFAHSKNVVHRDIKPGNILVDREGVPHLGDFGLARNVRTSDKLTVSGAMLGTPAYMSPEQANGKVNQVGRASDVYSLGAVLYELLTGRPPFMANTLPKLVSLISLDDPVAPRKLNRMVTADLETICLKCLEKDPQRRYPNARGLSMDIDRFLRGDVIHARQASVAYKSVKWLARNKLLSLSITLSLSVVALLVYLFLLAPGFLTITTQASYGGVMTTVYPEITIDNQRISRKSLQLLPLARGYHRVALSLEKYEPQEFFVQITPGKEIKLEKQLIRKKGKLSVTAPLQAEAKCRNLETGQSSSFLVPMHEYVMETGEYEVTFHKENHFAQTHKFVIRPEQHSAMHVHLQPMLLWRRQVSNKQDANSLAVADLDRDGKLELIYFTGNGGVVVYDLDSHEKLWQLTNSLAKMAFRTEIRDINKDSFPDLILAHTDRFMVIDGKTHKEIFRLSQYWGTTYVLADANGDGYDDYILIRPYHQIECYDSRTQKILWQNPLRILGSSPPLLIDAGHVLVANAGQMYELDIIKGQLSPYQSYKINDPGDIQLVAGKDGQPLLVCYRVDTGLSCQEKESRKMLWQWQPQRLMVEGFTAGDVDGDGDAEILIHHDHIYCLDAHSGREKWRCATGNEAGSTPMLSDLDGDGKLEVITCTPQGKICVVDSRSGALVAEFACHTKVRSLHTLDVDDDGRLEILFLADEFVYCIRHIPETKRRSFDDDRTIALLPPAIVDLNGDGCQEIIIGNEAQQVYALDGKTWQPIWRREMRMPVRNVLTVADVNGDRKPEVVVQAGKYLEILTTEGEKLWEYTLGEEQVWRVPLVADVNRDGKMEVIATDRLDACVYCLSGSSGALLWKTKTPRIYTSPRIFDPGQGPMGVVVASAMRVGDSGHAFCLSGRDGNIAWETRIPNPSSEGEITMLDINGDNVAEALIGQVGGFLSCIDGRTGAARWHAQLRGGDVKTHVVSGDFDGDGMLEIFATTTAEDIQCLDALTGKVKWYRQPMRNAATVTETDLTQYNSHVLSLGQDLDGDGLPDLMLLTSKNSFYLFSGKDGRWLGDSNASGMIACRPVVADLDNDRRMDFVFIDSKSRVTGIYDMASYFQKFSLPPRFFSLRSRDSDLLVIAHLQNLLKHGAYDRLGIELARHRQRLPKWNYMLTVYQAACELAQFGKITTVEETSMHLVEYRVLLAISALNQGQQKEAEERMKSLLQNSLLDIHEFFRKHEKLLNAQGKQLWRAMLPAMLAKTEWEQDLCQAYQYATFTNRNQEANYFLELSLRYGSTRRADFGTRKDQYLRAVNDMLKQVSTTYTRHLGFDILDHAHDVLPDNAEILFRRGQLYISSGLSAEQGRADIDRALVLQPDYAPALFMRGCLLHNQDKHADALRDFDNCVRLQPNEPEFLLALSLACVAGKQNARALKTLDRLSQEKATLSAYQQLASMIRDLASDNKAAARQKLQQMQGFAGSPWLIQTAVELMKK